MRYIGIMASKRRPPMSLRLSEESHRQAESIARRRGISKVDAIRQALAETDARERRRSGLRAEVEALMRDPAYVKEAREIAAMMEDLRGPW